MSGFDIVASGSTELVLDFDALKSVVQAGKSGKWLLKPTIKVIESVTYSVEGTMDEGVDAPLEGAGISAQIYDPGATDPKDEVTGVASALSDIDGNYFMYLPIIQDSFNIVATMGGYLPECQVLDSTGIKAYEMDFTLTQASDIGYFQGSLTGLVESAESADFSIRQELGPCGWIEVGFASIAKTVAPDSAEYFLPITLPVGTYQVVVSGFGEVTQVWEIQVVADETTVLDVYFPTPSVYGIVYDETDPLEGATISAQEYDDSAAVAELEVTEIDDTSSDSNGAYYMYLPTERPLNIVATMAGLEPQCEVITELTSYFIDFTLIAPAGGTGTFTGTVEVDGLTTSDSALFSIRQRHTSCGMIEVESIGVPEGATSSEITLPVGPYVVVVSAEGEVTLEQSINVEAATNTEVVFPAHN